MIESLSGAIPGAIAFAAGLVASRLAPLSILQRALRLWRRGCSMIPSVQGQRGGVDVPVVHVRGHHVAGLDLTNFTSRDRRRRNAERESRVITARCFIPLLA
jgi:hypothetical protein